MIDLHDRHAVVRLLFLLSNLIGLFHVHSKSRGGSRGGKMSEERKIVFFLLLLLLVVVVVVVVSSGFPTPVGASAAESEMTWKMFRASSNMKCAPGTGMTSPSTHLTMRWR